MTTYPSIYAYKYGDLYTLGAFAAGVGNAHENELAPQLVMGGVLGALPLAKATIWDGPKWLINNYGHYGETWTSMKDAHNAQKATAKAFKESLKGGENSVYNWLMKDARYQNYQGWQAKTPQPKYNTKLVRQLTKDGKTEEIASYKEAFKMQKKQSDCYKEARIILKRIKTQKLKGEELKAALKELEGAINKGDLKVLEGIKAGTIKPVGKWAKVWDFVKRKSGYNWTNRQLLKGMTYGVEETGQITKNGIGAKTLRTVAKGAKGGGLLTAGIEMAFETPEIIETYSKLGVGKGTKQLGKSAATATASAVGWVVGAKVGGIAGAKIGGAIGSFFGPGPGTAIGAAIGGIIGVGCGIAGSWLCHKGMKSIMGKTELEKHKEQLALEKTQGAVKSPEKKKELLLECKAIYEKEGGEQAFVDAYTKVVNERQEALAQTQTNEQPSQTTYEYTETTNGKSALLQQLESFNAYTSQYVSSNPFNKQSIFS